MAPEPFVPEVSTPSKATMAQPHFETVPEALIVSFPVVGAEPIARNNPMRYAEGDPNGAGVSRRTQVSPLPESEVTSGAPEPLRMTPARMSWFGGGVYPALVMTLVPATPEFAAARLVAV